MSYHVVVIVPQSDGWRAHLPDFPGCRAEAPRLEAAIDMAVSNALLSNGRQLADQGGQGVNGHAPPTARTYTQIRTDTRWADEREIEMESAVICWVNLSD